MNGKKVALLGLALVLSSNSPIGLTKSHTILAKELTYDQERDILINATEQSIFIYEDSSMYGDVIGMLNEGGTAFVLQDLDSCYYVVSGDYKGYIEKKSVLRGDEALKNEADYCPRQATILKDTVFLNEKSTLDGGVLSLYTNDAILSVLESSDDWLYVKDTNDIEGYISVDDASVAYVYSYAVEPDIALYCELYPERSIATYQDESDYDAVQEVTTIEEVDESTFIDELSLGQQVCDYALQFVGNPYVWGGTSLTEGSDCSGFVMKVYENFGIKLPRTSAEMRDYGYKVSDGLDLSLIQPGDVICYDGHVSIYLGNEQVISAASEELGIRISNVNYRTDYISVRRFVSGSQTRTIALNDEDKEILYRIVEAESGNQFFLGKVYVANVIINRLLSPSYPDSIEEIVFASRQFSPVWDGRYERVRITDETKYAVDYAISHADNSQGALYFMNPVAADECNAEWFNNSLTKLFTFRDHAFYK